MFSAILLNLIWSKNWNIIVQQVSYLQLVLRLYKIRKATLKTLETNTVILSNFYTFWYAFVVKINVPKEKLTWSKFNQKMIPISWVEVPKFSQTVHEMEKILGPRGASEALPSPFANACATLNTRKHGKDVKLFKGNYDPEVIVFLQIT